VHQRGTSVLIAEKPVVEQPPPSLPDFEILEEIGRGGMGIVYRAKKRDDGQIVAVKVIRKDRLQHEEAVKRFRREAQAAARLSHPNIVTVFDSDQTGDTHYLVMEFVAGITLERHVEQTGPLAIPQACDIIRQTALGLQHAWEQGLVHRDIKPSNLMVNFSSAGAAAVKLLDMGVARVLQLSGQAVGDSLSTLTHSGSVIGTADYVAPEQLEDPHGADIRADLYSLGCTFYFLLTGQVPFPGGSLLSKLDKQRWHEPLALTTLRGDVPPAVARVVQRLMAKRPADRFQTPGELADALNVLAKNDYRDPPTPPIEFKELRRLIGHGDAIGAARFTPDGRHIASGAKDGTLVYWNADTGQIQYRLPNQPQEIRCLAFAPSGDQIATASGLTIRFYDVRGQEIRRFTGHSGTVRCLAFSPDGKRLITGGDDKSIRLWEVASGREVQRFGRHTGAVTALCYVGDAYHMASAGKDQTIRVWDLKSGLEIELIQTSAGNVLDLAAAADGKRLASAHFDTVLRIWDLPAAKRVIECRGHKQMPSALAFTSDGRRLLSAGQDQTVRLWDTVTGAELACATFHTAGVNTLSVSADGTRVVTGGSDKTLVIAAAPKA